MSRSPSRVFYRCIEYRRVIHRKTQGEVLICFRELCQVISNVLKTIVCFQPNVFM